jgi:hypothetical protein
MVIFVFLLPAGLVYADGPEQAKLTASDGADGDGFGRSVSISGDYAIVGALGDDDGGSGSGSAYIFTPNDVDANNWDQVAKLTASDGAADDRFGWSVSISGDYAVVGAYGDDDNGSSSGSAYIFTPNDVDPNNWDQVAKLTASDAAAGDRFGGSVSISGDYAVVGAHYDDDNGTQSGSAYIFKRDGTNWSEQAKLLASDGNDEDYFGRSVSISGDYTIVGANHDDDGGNGSGSAYIFTPNDVDPNNWDQVAKLLASDGASGDYFGVSVSISGDYAVVGAYWDDDSGNRSGSAYIFERDGTSWSEQAKLLASDGAADDYFGLSVSISGDYAVVGADQDDDNGTESGSAYVFKRDGTNWRQQAKLAASDNAAYDRFGCSVSISGDYAIVGAGEDDDNGFNSGSAYVYYGHSAWIQGTKWHDTDADGHFIEDTDEQPIEGWRIYIDVNENGQFDAGEPNDITDAHGNYLLTAPAGGTWLIAEEAKPCWEQTYPGGEESYSVTLEKWEVVEGYNFGNARSTEIHASRWQQDQQDKCLAADGAVGDSFGNSVSISADYAIVGAWYDDDNGSNSGSAYVFAPNDANCSDSDWNEAAKLLASDGAADDYFGVSVSVRGHYAVVGASGDDDNGNGSGSAYIFNRSGTSWVEQAKLLASDGAGDDYFGHSVSISGDYAVVGAYRDDDNGSHSGSAYVFKRDGTNWSQQAKLTASDGAADDWFGYSVSISGDYTIVGAYADDDSGSASGSAYIFKRDGTSWSEQAKLSAADGAASDFFGRSVSISGDYAIVGAYGDDDNGDSSGSAYIFKRDGTSWSEQAKLTAADAGASDWFGQSVSVSGDYAVVGAYGDDDNGVISGSAYIFERNGTSWSEQVKWLAADGAADDRFGWSVSISGDYAVVGAYGDDDNGPSSGSAYVFGKVLCPRADLTGDCFVNFKDIAVIADEWLKGIE